MNFLKIIYIYIILAFASNNQAPSEVWSIDFGAYINAEYDASKCTYLIENVPIQFFNIYAPDGQNQLCDTPAYGDGAYQARIEKNDIPLTGNTVEVTLTQIGCPGVVDYFEYSLHYEDGTKLVENGTSATINDFANLDFLTITEMECGLIGKVNLPNYSIILQFESDL